MKKIILLLIVYVSCASVYSQVDNNSKKYNIPPGSVLKPKTNTEIDYSYKLSEIPSKDPVGYVEPDFFINFDKEALMEEESSSKEINAYYNQARAFFQSLSPKVKVIYTVDELWYIFQFDQKLRYKLVAIK